MSLEIKVNDSFVPFEFAPNSVKLDLEWALINNAEIKINCVTCHKEIPAGTGNACAEHTSYKVCKICLLPHAGLYCSNCFTGERVNVSAQGKFNKWAKVIRIHDITKKVGN